MNKLKFDGQIIYDSGKKIGTLKGDSLYDTKGRRLGYIRGSSIYDNRNIKIGFVSSDAVLNSQSKRIGSLRDIKKEIVLADTLAATLFMFFVYE